MITLQRPKLAKFVQDKHQAFVVKAAPGFVESAKGYYAHRVRSAVLYNIHKKPHTAVHCWCGMTVLIGGSRHSKNAFVDEPSLGRPICATCEGRVIGATGMDDYRINGRLVRHSPQY